jgi:hypothetical protein
MSRTADRKREAKEEAARESYAEGVWYGKAWAGVAAKGQDLDLLKEFHDRVKSEHSDFDDWFEVELMAPWSHAGLIAAAIIGCDDENEDRLDAERFADELFPEEKANDLDYLRGFVAGALQIWAES